MLPAAGRVEEGEVLHGKETPKSGSTNGDGKKDMIFDLAVAGAGPAGSLAAALAAGAGLEVVLLEKKSFPRPKPCGGLISAKALSLLPPDFSFPGDAACPIGEIAVCRRGKRYARTPEKEPGVLVNRSLFDQALARYAAGRGAVLMEKRKVKACLPEEGCLKLMLEEGPEKDSLKVIRTRHLAGAWGASSLIPAIEGLTNRAPGPAGLAVVSMAGGLEEGDGMGRACFYPLPHLGGMGWSFSAPGLLNRGVGGLAGYGKLIEQYRALFPEDGKRRLKAWPLPFCGALKKVASGRVILIGDAAGLVDPFSGEGLYNSFLSAHFCLHALARAARGRESAASIYNRLFNRRFRLRLPLSLLQPPLLHAASIICPGLLPKLIEKIMLAP